MADSHSLKFSNTSKVFVLKDKAKVVHKIYIHFLTEANNLLKSNKL